MASMAMTACAGEPSLEPGEAVEIAGGPEMQWIERSAWPEGRFDQASTAELAAWLLDDPDIEIAEHDWAFAVPGNSLGIWLYEPAQPLTPGVCKILFHRVIAFRNTPPSFVGDLLIEPSSMVQGELYRSTDASGGCQRTHGEHQGFSADSDALAVEAVSLYRLAQAFSGERLDRRLKCADADARVCRALLARLRPELIDRVDREGRSTVFHLLTPDPDDPGDWIVSITGRRSPESIRIERAPPPPPA